MISIIIFNGVNPLDLYLATLTIGYPCYRATISESKLCIGVYPSQEATVLMRIDFSFPMGGLKRGEPLYISNMPYARMK